MQNKINSSIQNQDQEISTINDGVTNQASVQSKPKYKLSFDIQDNDVKKKQISASADVNNFHFNNDINNNIKGNKNDSNSENITESLLNFSIKPEFPEEIIKTGQKMRWLILFLAVIVIMGTEYAYYNPMPVEEMLKEELEIGNVDFNMLFIFYSVPNIIAPLFAGQLVGKYGPRLVMALFLSISLIGQTIIFFGILAKSFIIVIIGRIFLGIGSECVQVGQSTIVSMWFDNKELSLAIGISLAFPMVGGSLNSAISPIIGSDLGLSVAFLAGLFILGLSMLACIILIIIDKRQQKIEQDFIQQQKKDMGESIDINQPQHEAEAVNCDQIKEINGLSWLVLIIAGFSIGLMQPFMDNANSFVQKRFSQTDSKAGTIVALPDLISASLTPFLGIFVDRIPQFRTRLIIFSCLLFLGGHFFVGALTCEEACSEAYFPFIVLGLAFTTYYSIIMPTIPYSVDEKLLGTVFGIGQMFSHTTMTVFVLITGSINDHFKNDPFKGYGVSNIFFVSMAILCVLLSIVIYIYEKKKRLLNKSTRSRLYLKSASKANLQYLAKSLQI